MSAPLDEDTLAALHGCLLAERERLTVELAEYEREGHENLSDASGENNYRDHMGDQGTATFNREIDMTIVDNTTQLLAQVDRALGRMHEGTYGTCVRCGEPVGADRLEAMPAAELCIACKQWEESAG
jgi:RNA polymerase-binding protein DksA